MIEIIIVSISLVVSLVTLIVVLYLFSKSKNKINVENGSLDITPIKDQIDDAINKVIDRNGDIVTKLNSALQDRENKFNNEIKDIKTSLDTDNQKFKNDVKDSFNILTDKLNRSVKEEIELYQKNANDEFRKNYELLMKQVNDGFVNINEMVNKKLGDGFKTNTETLNSVTESLGRITEAQKNLDNLSKEVNSLNGVLTNSQTRGRFGEVVLENILLDVFGDTNGCYDTQVEIKLDNRVVKPDAVVYLPEPDSMLCIDSKFSFVDYKALVESKEENIDLKKKFRDDLKAEIKKIADDYIIEGKTACYAIMFIPNDGIYTYLQTDDYFYNNVINYARQLNVIICSPSTLQPILANVRMLKVNVEISKNIKTIVQDINKLGKETSRLGTRWDEIIRQTEKLSDKQKELSTTIGKITKDSSDILNRAKKQNLIEDQEEVKEDL